MKIGQSGYHETTYNPTALKRTVTRVSKKLKKLQKKLKFDAIAFRGSSGAAIAYPVSMVTGIHLIYVRKGINHHGNMIEASDDKDVKRYIILDDFIESGNTVKAIINKITSFARYDDRDEKPECVGIALYSGSRRCGVWEVGRKEYPIFAI